MNTRRPAAPTQTLARSLAFSLALSLPLSLGACSNEPEAPAVVPDLETTFESLPEDAAQPADEATLAGDGSTPEDTADGAANGAGQGMASGSNQPDATAPDPRRSKLIKADPPR